MAYPPELPPAGRTDTTAQAGDHASDHNQIAVALQDFLDELGAAPSGGFSSLTSRLAAGGIGPGSNAGFTVDPDKTTVLVVQPGGNAYIDPVDADILVIDH